MVSQLEDLPNELFWFIMEYIPPIDLFQAFFNLNQRLNTVISLIHFRFNLLFIKNNQFDYFRHRILPNIQLDWIESIYLDDISNRLDSIKFCQNLRSLMIDHLHTDHLNSLAKYILPELKQLNHLHLHSDFILKNTDVNELTQVIFSERMPLLTYCYFAFEDFGRMSFNHLDRTNRTLSLQTLIIDQWCHLKDFIQLLHCIPNIQRLTVRLFNSDMKGTIFRYLNGIDDFTILVPHLIYFRAKLSQISFSIATNILFQRLPSQLRELSLSTWSIEYANGDIWQNLLSSKFEHLKYFRLIISLDQIPSNYSIGTLTDLDQSVKSFNQTKYFLDRQWNVLLNVNECDRLKFVLHSMPYPIENFQTTLENIRRCTSSTNMFKSTYCNVKKLTLTLHDDFIDNHIELRNFSNVNQLIFLSNLTSNCEQFPSRIYFHHLITMINLSNITSLSFSEVSHPYPIILINLLLENLSKLYSLTLSYQLYACLKLPSYISWKNLNLIFAIYSSVSPPTSRMRYLLSPDQILTNNLIIELVQRFNISNLQILSLSVRDLDGFDNQFSSWLNKNFSIEQNLTYDLLLVDKIVRFFF